MIEIPKYLVKELCKYVELFGYACSQGTVIGDKEFIIWQKENKSFLVHKSELDQQEFLVRLKK